MRRASWRSRAPSSTCSRSSLRSPGRVFERSQLLEAVWGSDVVVGDRTIDVHIKALRRKIEEAGGDPRVLETVRGVGYRLRDDG